MPTESPLRTPGKAIRITVTAVCLALIVAGTLWGQDDHFPFGPFRMYATTDKLNHPVGSSRMEAVSADGRRFVFRGGDTGARRAEIEGQMKRFRAHPSLLGSLARAYDRGRPKAKRLVQIQIIVRFYELKNGEPTGKHRDRTAVTWNKPGAHQS